MIFYIDLRNIFNRIRLFYFFFQTGKLTVEVPPDFIQEETSGDVTVLEGYHVSNQYLKISTLFRIEINSQNHFEN